MLPDGVLSSEVVESDLIGGRAMEGNELLDHEDGGIALNDTSAGLMYQIWQGDCDGTDVILSPASGGSTVIYTGTDITEMSFTFDQNMQSALAFVDEGDAKFRWYDSNIAGYTITALANDVLTPKVFLDDKRAFNLANSDIILGYVKQSGGNTSLYYRMQRDRYETEYLLDTFDDPSGSYELYKIGMGKNLRVHFITSTSEAQITVTDPYDDCESCGDFDENNPYDFADMTEPYEECEDCGSFNANDPYDASGGADPYGDCGDVCNDPAYDTDIWTPWGDGYFYVSFPLSTYVTNIWAATTSHGSHPVGTLIAPTTDNGYYYRASNDPYQGETGATEPTWPTVFGETVVDGDLIWECYGYRTLTSDYMTENSRPSIRETKKFGDYILTLSDDYVLECWDAIPNLYGKKNANENVELVWRQHVRTFGNLQYDEYLGLIVTPANDVIFLDTEDGWNGDGVNWLNTDGSFDKYTRLRTKNQSGVRLQSNVDFVSSHTADTTVIKTIRYTSNVLYTVTYEYDSPGVYIPTNEATITYGLETGWYVFNNLYSTTKATVTLSGESLHSLVTLNNDGSVTEHDQVDTNVWTSALHGGYSDSWIGSDVVLMENGYLLVGPVSSRRWQYLLCEPDTINPITY